jgi:putative protease
VAGVVKTYREAINSLGAGAGFAVDPRWSGELSMFSSRGYTTGMFFGPQADADYNFDGESYRMSHELVGVVTGVRGGIATVGLRHRLDAGDLVQFLSPGLEEKLFEIRGMKDRDAVEVVSARNGEVVFIPAPHGVRTNDIIRRDRSLKAREGMKNQGGVPPLSKEAV